MSEIKFKFDEHFLRQQLENGETNQTQLSPLVQGNLRVAVYRNREARGDCTPIAVEFNKPKAFPLTEDEKEKRERRKEQNRRAARKCRLKKKENREKGLDEKTIRQLKMDNESLTISIGSLREELKQLEHALTRHQMSGQCVRHTTHLPRDYPVIQSAARDQQVPDQLCYSPSGMTQYSVPTPPMYNYNDNHVPKPQATPNIWSGEAELLGQGLASPNGQYMDNHDSAFQYSLVSDSDSATDQSRNNDGQCPQLPGDETSTNIECFLGNEQHAQSYPPYKNSTENVLNQTWPITGNDTWLTSQVNADAQALNPIDREPEVIPSDKIGIPSLDAIPISQLVSLQLISGCTFPDVAQRH